MSQSVEYHSVRKVAIKLKTSIRTIQQLCKDLQIPKFRNKYLITDAIVQILAEKRNVNAEITQNVAEIERRYTTKIDDSSDDSSDDIIMQPYTLDEYQEIQKRLIEYNQFTEKIADLKNEINYLRSSLDKQSDQMSRMLQTFDDTIKSIRERNAIDYKNANDSH